MPTPYSVDGPPKPEPGDPFPGRTVRHGTTSGWRLHQLQQDMCDACRAAKARYDWERAQQPDVTLRNRAYAAAQNRALVRLRRAHFEEYRRYYEEERALELEDKGLELPRWDQLAANLEPEPEPEHQHESSLEVSAVEGHAGDMKTTKRRTRDPKWGFTEGPYDPIHGTQQGYGIKKCRCDDCRLAWREYCRELADTRMERMTAEGREIPHGHNGYHNYMCRCDICTAAYEEEKKKAHESHTAAAYLAKLRANGQTKY